MPTRPPSGGLAAVRSHEAGRSRRDWEPSRRSTPPRRRASTRRHAAGLTGHALAAIIGLDQSRISRIELGRLRISEFELQRWLQETLATGGVCADNEHRPAGMRNGRIMEKRSS
ncbi:helix-turn-helix transcriptional regulator [Pseudonocardia sp. ICBG601]|uniref:helix-turn-helix domain-containing protein n=1 Tax=Pseudonocardia sp. ICBG601 TaxID=2846759 RepID=UPI001CF6415A